jgi:hypothetical protein
MAPKNPHGQGPQAPETSDVLVAHRLPSERPAPMQTTVAVRIVAEYREMPGMHLTLPQAARLFALDQQHCARVLDTLVSSGVLRRTGSTYAVAGTGRGDT